LVEVGLKFVARIHTTSRVLCLYRFCERACLLFVFQEQALCFRIVGFTGIFYPAFVPDSRVGRSVEGPPTFNSMFHGNILPALVPGCRFHGNILPAFVPDSRVGRSREGPPTFNTGILFWYLFRVVGLEGQGKAHRPSIVGFAGIFFTLAPKQH
jgi:hypothetical protein